METKTEVGKILQSLNYIDSQVARFDELALHLYCIPMEERNELLAALMWYCGAMKKDGTVHPCYKKYIDRYDDILAKANE